MLQVAHEATFCQINIKVQMRVIEEYIHGQVGPTFFDRKNNQRDIYNECGNFAIYYII